MAAFAVEDLVVPEHRPVRFVDPLDDRPERRCPVGHDRDLAVPGEGRVPVGLAFDVVPDVGAAPEPGHPAEARRPDRLSVVGPDRLVALVVLGFGAGKQVQVEEGPLHRSDPVEALGVAVEHPLLVLAAEPGLGDDHPVGVHLLE